MSTSSLFTETPIEAALWSFSVSLQERLAVSLFQTSYFKGAVSLYMGFVVARGLWRWGLGRDLGGWVWVGSKLLCCFLGLAFLNRLSSQPFSPQMESGASWASKAPSPHKGGLGPPAHGLQFYRMAAQGMNHLSSLVSQSVAGVFGDGGHAKSPRLLVQTLYEAARHTIDDAETLSSIDSLFESCARSGTASSEVAYPSLSSQFDLERAGCAQMHAKLKSQLDSWARGRISSPGSKLLVYAEAARNNAFMRSLGLDESQTLKHKVIASGVSDHLRSRVGLSYNNVSAEALLDSQSLLGTSTWVGLSRMASLGGLMNLAVRPFTGTDYEAADSRNDLAALYTKVSVFLPAIRGFAKGILALMFLVASARMAFGSVGLMVSWGWGLLLITAYEPLSTFLYQATLTLTQSPETLGALGALKNDPLAVVGAQVMDSYASRVQATYFVLQLGLTALTAAGGLAVFRYQRALGGGLAGVVANKGLGMVRNLALIKAGGVGAVAASKVGGKS